MASRRSPADPPAKGGPPRAPLSFAEIVGLTAATMALNALAIDMMLPALGTIGDELAAPRDNDRQLIVAVYVIANGFAQLAFGPLVDRFGRRPVLLGSLGAYCAGCLLSVAATSFPLLLAARGFQGVATAASRVAIVAMLRDRYAGRRMAAAMSLAITVFMAAPIVAPGLGQAILFAAPWRWIFGALLVYGAGLGLWVWARAPETLDPAARAPLDPGAALRAYGVFASNRCAAGYTLASALCFGALFGYIGASEQIFLEVFDLGSRFFLAFAAVAGALALATLVNARIVERVGMRRLTHGALLAFFLIALAHLASLAAGGESLPRFLVFMAGSFFCLGLIGPNASAIALEPMGRIAGAAAAANGFAGTALAGFLGAAVGRFYDGSTAPIVVGFAVFGGLALLAALWAERGRLFRTGEAAEAAR